MGAAASDPPIDPFQAAFAALGPKLQSATGAEIRIDSISAMEESAKTLPLVAAESADVAVDLPGKTPQHVIVRMRLATLAELVGLVSKLAPEEIAKLRDAGAWNAERRGAFQTLGSVVGDVFAATAVELHVPADVAFDTCVAGALGATIHGAGPAAPIVITRAVPEPPPPPPPPTPPKATAPERAAAPSTAAAAPKPAGPKRTPRPGPWVIAASDAVAKLLAEGAAKAGATSRRVNVQTAPSLGRENVLLVEVGATTDGAAEEALLRRGLRARAMPVAVIIEPTIERFARAVRAGALDVMAGALAPETIAERATHWSLPAPKPIAR